MGAGGLSGELRDHSEHVDAILRSRFQVNGPRSPEWQANDSRYSTHFTFPGDVLEEMPCADCTSNFSLFRRKNLCRNCKRYYCSECFTREPKLVLGAGEINRLCLSCRALHFPLVYKDNLISLKVKDLQDYLRSRHISLSHCKEKTDLVDLIIRHAEERAPSRSSTLRVQQHSRQQLQRNSNQPRPHSFHSVWSSQVRSPSSQAGLYQSHSRDLQSTQVFPPSAESFPGKSLNDIQNIEDIKGLSVKELKCILSANFVDFKGCCEKDELLQRVRNLWKSKQGYDKKSSAAEDEDTEWEDQCKICMDAGIDCVLLECGHMVTCTKCGKQISDCPICRQHISRIVHVFKA